MRKKAVLFMCAVCAAALMGCGNNAAAADTSTETVSLNVTQSETESSESNEGNISGEADTTETNTAENTTEATTETTTENNSGDATGTDFMETDGDSKSDAAQIYLIDCNLENLENEFMDNAFAATPAYTVTDLNHNGRLEIIFSDCQGTGAFSTTAIYEVSETYDSLERMSTKEDDNYDYTGDFTNVNVNTSRCDLVWYEVDGTYYYVVSDYTSAGWDWKGETFYLYSFNGKVECNVICSYVVSGVLDENNNASYNVTMYDSNRNICASEEDYNSRRDTFLSSYGTSSSCTLTWIYFSDEGNVEDNLWACYTSFTSTPGSVAEDYGYKNIWGEDVDYTIVTE